VLVFEQAGHALFVDEPARFNAAALALARRAFGDD
jgi:pimeloyl-ACP methyl ester carboxylesterase